jgi:hypothetical protein
MSMNYDTRAPFLEYKEMALGTPSPERIPESRLQLECQRHSEFRKRTVRQ